MCNIPAIFQNSYKYQEFSLYKHFRYLLTFTQNLFN